MHKLPTPSLITAEAFLAPTPVRRKSDGAIKDKTISNNVLQSSVSRITKRREKLLSKASSSNVIAASSSDSDHADRERDVRDAVQSFCRVSPWLDDLSEAAREDILTIVAQHQRGVVTSSEFRQAVTDAKRSIAGCVVTSDEGQHIRLKEYHPRGGW